jgi:DNA-nicking Smr family endonuclease
MGRNKKRKHKKADITPSGPKRKPAPFNNPFRDQAATLKETMTPSAEPADSQPTAQKSTSNSFAPPQQLPLSEEEQLFRQAMIGVQKLDRTDAPLPKSKNKSPPKTRSDDAEVLAQLADLVTGAVAFDISDTAEYIEGIAQGLDRRLLKKLRRGDFSVQAHLDLHGLNRMEARDAVERFLVRSRQKGQRCVLIISGRGHHSKDKTPVLKTHLGQWLTHGRLSKKILAFCSARRCDGGVGAVYVLLRK